MESRPGILLLIRTGALSAALALALAGCSSLRQPWWGDDVPQPAATAGDVVAEAPAAPPRIVEPEVQRREIRRPAVDTENFEVGIWYGALGVEDFGTNPAYGAKAAYHISEDFFFEASLGRTRLGKTSFEELNPGSDPLNLGSERQLTYYSLSFGYNFLPGEAFVGRNLAMNSAFYLLGGIGSVEFAGDQKFSVSFGAGYRVLPNDWLTLSIDVQDRLFESDIFGTNKLTNNLEARIGVTAFF